jgi:hypothetical protein
MKMIGTLRMILAAILTILGLALPAQATYTGLLVTSGGNLYEMTSSGTLTLAAGNLGVSLGAIVQYSAMSGSDSDIMALNSAGTDLYEIVVYSDGTHTITHVGSLGVTGVGLTKIGSTLYTMVSNSDGLYDLYTINTSTGAASLSKDGFISVVDNITTDGTGFFVTQASGHNGAVDLYTLTGSLQENANYRYSAGVYVNADLAAFNGTTLWLFDNSSYKLSNGTYTSGFVTVTVDATLNTNYNGMCWGYVPF